MRQVDEVIEMAALFVPSGPDPVRFALNFDGEVWRAEVRRGKYYLDASGQTAAAAIADLHRQAVDHTRRVSSWAGRLLARFDSRLKVAN